MTTWLLLSSTKKWKRAKISWLKSGAFAKIFNFLHPELSKKGLGCLIMRDLYILYNLCGSTMIIPYEFFWLAIEITGQWQWTTKGLTRFWASKKGPITLGSLQTQDWLKACKHYNLRALIGFFLIKWRCLSIGPCKDNDFETLTCLGQWFLKLTWCCSSVGLGKDNGKIGSSIIS